MELSLRIVSFNVENLFVSPQSEPFKENQNKISKVIQPGDKDFPLTLSLARSICEMGPDILGLMEVGGPESLEAFNHFFLDDKFHPGLIPGNSERNIHLGYLINKELPYHFEQFTHRNRPLNPLAPRPDYFSRDLAELRIYAPDDKKREAPLLIVLTVHLKSKRSEGQDFGGQKKRALELNLVLKIYQHLDKRFQSKVPIILMGDFNTVIHEESEFFPLFEASELVDILDILEYPRDERATQTSFSRQNEVIAQQFDYIFIAKKWHPLIQRSSSGIYYFRDQNAQVIRRPQSSFERAQLPSDHYPLICDLDISQLYSF